MKISKIFNKLSFLLIILIILSALLYPVNIIGTRLLLLFGILLAWSLIIRSIWRLRWLRIALLAFSSLFIVSLAFIPGASHVPELHNSYIRELRRYEGCRYIWGGENCFGIDCSGLPRKAIRTAMFRHGLTGKFQMFRYSLENWWFDVSAKALASGYREYVRPLNLSGTVLTAPKSQLIPGDLAITECGVHVMVFLGKEEWISADPGQGKVLIEDPSKSKNPWFTCRVNFYRWSILDHN